MKELSLFEKIFGGLNVLVILAGIGAYVHFSGKKSVLNQGKEVTEFNESLMYDNQDLYVELPKMTVNLVSDRTRLHYLDTQINLIPLNRQMLQYLNQKEISWQIMSAIIEVTGLHTPQDITNVSGKICSWIFVLFITFVT